MPDKDKNLINADEMSENAVSGGTAAESFAESIAAAAESYADAIAANPPAPAVTDPAAPEAAEEIAAPVAEATHVAYVDPENVPLLEKPLKKPVAKKKAAASSPDDNSGRSVNPAASDTKEKKPAAKKAAAAAGAPKAAGAKKTAEKKTPAKDNAAEQAAAETLPDAAEPGSGGHAENVVPEGLIGGESVPAPAPVKAKKPFKPKDVTKLTAAQRQAEQEADPRSVAMKQEKLKAAPVKKKINETNSGLKLLYQPIFEPAKSNLIGFECLLRIYDIELGILTPGMFLDVAQKDLKLIKRLEDWSIEEVLKSSKKLKEQNVSILSVNISTKHFFDADFVETTSRIIERSEIRPTNIYFEMREEVLFGPYVEVVNKMTALQALGIKIGIDDFGTNFFDNAEPKSDFPLDMVKLPFGLVKRFLNDRKSKSLVRIILNYAKQKRIEVIALGVESKAQEEALLKMGVRQMQGYLYSKPLATQRMNLKKK